MQIITALNYYDQTPISVEISDHKITRITPLEQTSAERPELYIAPGLVDNQVNGFCGVTFALGNGILTAEGIHKATQALWQYGVTTYLPTLTTNSHELLLKNLQMFAQTRNSPALHGSIVGIHLEGPYLSPDDGYRGAHPKAHVRLPDWHEFMEFYEASGHNILQITLAPEMPGALDFITKCRDLGVVVALGHHNAPTAIITEAINRGAQIATHLGNGLAANINRYKNPLWAQLADDRFKISIICDNFHLLPEQIAVFYKVKGSKNTILTSDVTNYGCLPPGTYQTDEGQEIKISEEGLLWNVTQNGLYGSASPLSKGVGHIMQVTGCSLADAIQMASTNPAQLYNLNDRGQLAVGKRADLILFSLQASKIQIRKTWVDGQMVYDAPAQT